MKKILKKNGFWLFLIIVLGLVLRIYKINNPILDLYPIRQEQCAMLARNFLKDGLNIFSGRVDWYGNWDSRWVLEFPLISYLAALCYNFFGIKELFGRMISVLFSVGSLGIFYLLVSQFFNRKVAILAVLLFAVSPLNIYFGRVFIPEPLMLFFSLTLLWSFNHWLETDKKIYYFLALVSGALSFLIKIPTLYLLAVLVYLAFLKWKTAAVKKFSLWFYLIVSLLPVLFWYSRANIVISEHMSGFSVLRDIFINPHFYTRMLERFLIFVFTPIGIFPFMTGFLKKPQDRKQAVFYIWFLVLVIYFLRTADMNYTHFYYQLPFVPVVCVFIARGLLDYTDPLFWKNTILAKIKASYITVALLILMVVGGWFSIQPFYNYNRAVYELGLLMRRTVPSESLIIAGRCSGQAPLYYCDRKGWEINEEGKLSYVTLYRQHNLPLFADELSLLNYLISEGADYYLAADLEAFNRNPWLADYIKKNYKVFLSSDKYLVFDLRK